MQIYFEDWSMFVPTLDQKGLRHGGRIIKVFATHKDVRQTLRRDAVTVFEMDESPFREDEVFDYGERGEYTGVQLEQDLMQIGLTELGMQTFRALFRFSYENGFNQSAMAERKEDDWLIQHPFEDIDGVTFAVRNPEGRTSGIHLDVFFQESLKDLDQLLPTQNALVDWKTEGRTLRAKENAL